MPIKTVVSEWLQTCASSDESAVLARAFEEHRGNETLVELIGIKKNIIIVSMGFMPIVMFNPSVKSKEGPFETEEGCLSLDGTRKTTRYKNIEVEFMNMSWQKQTLKLSGWEAQICQHEIDHLQGIII